MQQINVTPGQVYAAVQSQGFYCLPADNLNADYAMQLLLKQIKGKSATILVPERKFKITQPIVLGPGQCIAGIGRASTFDCSAMPSGSIAITFDTQGGVSNLQMIGNSGVVALANVQNAAFYRFDNLFVTGFALGCKLNCTWIGDFFSCVFNYNTIGMQWINYVNAVNIHGGHFGGNGIGIDCRNKEALQMKNIITSTIEGNTTSGIYLDGLCSSISIRDCYFETNGDNNTNGEDIYIGTDCDGTVIDGCFGVRSNPMFRIKGLKTRISNCVGWSRNFAFIDSAARDTVVDFNSFYTKQNYEVCVGIIDFGVNTHFSRPAENPASEANRLMNASTTGSFVKAKPHTEDPKSPIGNKFIKSNPNV